MLVGCSNPMAGTDTTLLGLAGAGWADGRSFGFAACERAVGASEGINLVMQCSAQQPGSEVGHAVRVPAVSLHGQHVSSAAAWCCRLQLALQLESYGTLAWKH